MAALEKEKENPPEVVAFRELPYNQRQIVLAALEQNGSMEAFIALKERGVDFAALASVETPQEKWRFIDQDEVLRLMDAASRLPEDMRRDLADMVESRQAQDVLREMAILEELVESGRKIADLIAAADTARKVEESGMNVDELLAAAQTVAALEQAGQTLEDISRKIRNAEAQEAALVGALKSELGGLVSKVGGRIDGSGAIILPDAVLFERGKAHITPVLRTFLADVCGPWLSVLKNSGVDIAEVKIEGHASSEWRSGSSARQAYLGNLDLSQRRSQAVLRACLDFVRDPEVLEWARTHMIAVGYSSVRPVIRDGDEDNAASRRVVFSATPNRQNLIDEIETEAGAYNQSRFGGWADPDGDCRDTRHELLAERSAGRVTRSYNGCTVVRGEWTDPYSGRTFTRADDVDVDHLAPLKWAWDHGASEWPRQKREEFANDAVNLVVVHDAVNREKRAMGPDEWLPPVAEFRCEYLTRFRGVVAKYDLTLDDDETSAFEQLTGEYC